MSKLQQFLKENTNISEATEEVPISKRFKDDDGTLLNFKIKPVRSEEYADYQQQAIVLGKNREGSRFDTARFNGLVVINHTLDPNFKDAATIKAAGLQTPEQLLNATLLAGEIDTLSSEILRISGFNIDLEELRKEAKN